MPILESGGRIYRSFEDCAQRTGGIHADSSIRRMQAFVISAPADSDLLDPANWCMSNKLPYDAAYSSGWENPPIKPGWLEGNVVETPAGALWNIIRVNTDPVVDKAAIIHIHDEGRRVSFDPASDFIDLPGGMTKFAIRRDPESGLYCMLCNNNTDPRYPNQRNVLSLFSSVDLIKWELCKTLIEDDSGLPWEDSIEQVASVLTAVRGDDILRASHSVWRGLHDANASRPPPHEFPRRCVLTTTSKRIAQLPSLTRTKGRSARDRVSSWRIGTASLSGRPRRIPRFCNFQLPGKGATAFTFLPCGHSRRRARCDAHRGRATALSRRRIRAASPLAGLPRMGNAALTPLSFACYTSADRRPLTVHLEAFNPLIPLDIERSGLPVAIMRFRLVNRTDEPVQASVAGSLYNFIGCDSSKRRGQWSSKPAEPGQLLGGNVNELRQATTDRVPLQGLLMRSQRVAPRTPQDGTMALVALSGEATWRAAGVQNHGTEHSHFWDILVKMASSKFVGLAQSLKGRVRLARSPWPTVLPAAAGTF